MRITLAIDYDGDWATLYKGNNRIGEGHISNMREQALDAAGVHVCDVTGLLDAESGETPPSTLLELRKRFDG